MSMQRIAAITGSLIAATLSVGDILAAGEGARWGARDPVLVCSEIDTVAPPSLDQIADLIRCEKEAITASDELWLLQDVSVRIGGSRPYMPYGELLTMPDVDTTKEVYPLRGSWALVVCRDPTAVSISGGNPALNCASAPVPKAEGACWMTTFGTWRCNMTGSTGERVTGLAPPQ